MLFDDVGFTIAQQLSCIFVGEVSQHPREIAGFGQLDCVGGIIEVEFVVAEACAVDFEGVESVNHLPAFLDVG